MITRCFTSVSVEKTTEQTQMLAGRSQIAFPPFPPRAVLADHRNPIPSAPQLLHANENTHSNPTPRDTRQGVENYVTTRRAYCDGRATVQQLAHALALVQNEVES